MRRFLFLLAGFLFLSALAAAGGGAWLFTRPGPLPEKQAVVIPHGGYASTIAALQDNAVLRPGPVEAFVFKTGITLTRHDGQLHAAELEFPAHATMREVLFVLRHAPPVRHHLTIPEGLTAHQIAALLDAAPFLSGANPDLPEGSILPQTYDYLRDTKRTALVQRMQQAMRTSLAASWAERDPALKLTDPTQMLTLASIVEKETGLPAERPMVARVFLNRLAQGMKLQSDPTTIYVLNNGAGPLGRPLTHADLAIDSPFNTYVADGLPPGPICSPGLAALQAVAHPATSNALYFVASGEGGHLFAETLADHNHNVAALRQREATGK